MEIVLGILGLANLLCIWLERRAIKRAQRRERELLTDAESWQARKQSEVRLMAAYRDGGSWVISDADRRAGSYYLEVNRN